MTYGRVLALHTKRNVDGAVVSHLAELVRGDFSRPRKQGPLIRPSATFSPRGEGPCASSLEFFTGSFAGMT